MKESTRRAALRYAMKATIVVAMSGCYESHARPWHSTPARFDGGTDAPVWADVPPPDAPAPRPDFGPVECDALLASLAITDPSPMEETWHWGATFTDPAVHADTAVGACCVEMDHAAEIDPFGAETGTPLAMACCEVIVSDQRLVPYSNLGCTPWGPPCPPAMPDDVDVA